MPLDRPAYPSDVSDEKGALVAPYLALLREDSAPRDHDLREVFNGLRYVVKTGAPWRFMPHDLPPWAAVFHHHASLCIAAYGFPICERGRFPPSDRPTKILVQTPPLPEVLRSRGAPDPTRAACA